MANIERQAGLIKWTGVENDACADSYGRCVRLLHQEYERPGMRWVARRGQADRSKKISTKGDWREMPPRARDGPGRHVIPAWLAPSRPEHSLMVHEVRPVVGCAGAVARSDAYPRAHQAWRLVTLREILLDSLLRGSHPLPQY